MFTLTLTFILQDGQVLTNHWDYRDLNDLYEDLGRAIDEQAVDVAIYYQIENQHGLKLRKGHSPIPMFKIA